MSKKIILLLIVLIVPAGLALAARPTEVTYPEVPGMIRPVTVTALLPDYVRYIFNLIIISSGLVCFGAIFYAGFTFLISAGNPGRQKEASNHILLALLGTVITLAAYIISNSINPQLVTPHLGVDALLGVIVRGGDNRELKLASDTPYFATGDGNLFEASSIEFISSSGSLQVLVYPDINYGGTPQKIDSSVDSASINGRSIRFLWQLPGVYLCTGTYSNRICQGEERYLPADTALLEGDFENNIGGLRTMLGIGDTLWSFSPPCAQGEDDCGRDGGRIVQQGDRCLCVKNTYYGAVLHEDANWSGRCEIFVQSDDNVNSGSNLITGKPNFIGSKASSVTTFTRKRSLNEGGSGEGVWLCEEPFVTREDCKGPFTYAVDAFGEGAFSDVPAATLLGGISSIIIDGDYLAILFEGSGFGGECQVFTSSDNNFLDNPIGRCGCLFGNWGCHDCANSAIIIPL